MEALTKLSLWQDNGLYIGSGFNDLIIKIENTEEELEDEILYTTSVDVYEASEVSIDVYRRWKGEDNVKVVEIDSEEANKNLLELTGEKEEIREFVEQTEEV